MWPRRGIVGIKPDTNAEHARMNEDPDGSKESLRSASGGKGGIAAGGKNQGQTVTLSKRLQRSREPLGEGQKITARPNVPRCIDPSMFAHDARCIGIDKQSLRASRRHRFEFQRRTKKEDVWDLDLRTGSLTEREPLDNTFLRDAIACQPPSSRSTPCDRVSLRDRASLRDSPSLTYSPAALRQRVGLILHKIFPDVTDERIAPA